VPTPKTKTVKRAPVKRVTDIASKFRQHLVLRLQSESIAKQADLLKKEIVGAIEAQGYQDDKGHYWLDLDETVTVDGWGTSRRLQRQKRVAQPMDEDTVETIATKKGLWCLGEKGGILTQIIVIDEDELRKAYFEGKFTKAEFDKMFPQKVTWAFVPEKV
jgi:hypothetical protein